MLVNRLPDPFSFHLNKIFFNLKINKAKQKYPEMF